MILRIWLSMVVLCFCVGTAYAQFVIENAKISLSVSGGERHSSSITVHNPTREDVDVRAYWEDFEYIPPYDGSKKFSAAGTLPGSASQWVSFSPQEFTLPAFGKQRINFTINVPRDIQGGHQGVMFFEKTDLTQAETTGVKIVFRTGALFFIEAKDRVKKAEFEGIACDGSKFSANFVNQGDVMLAPKITYYIMDESAYIVDRGDVGRLYVPAAVAAPLEVALSTELKPGKYTFVLNADMEDGDVAVNEVEFVKDRTGNIAF